MNTLFAPAYRHGHPVRFALLAFLGAVLLLLVMAAEAVAGSDCAHHGAVVAAESHTALHADAGTGTDHERFPEHRACTCIGDCLAPTAILPPDALIEPASWPAESRSTLLPAPALDLHGYAPYTLPYSQAPPLAG